jgi:hypothetical protein
LRGMIGTPFVGPAALDRAEADPELLGRLPLARRARAQRGFDRAELAIEDSRSAEDLALLLVRAIADCGTGPRRHGTGQ